jgi:predicted DNA-binding transcriptional regulator YafY
LQLNLFEIPVNKNAVRRFQIIDSLLRRQPLSFTELYDQLNAVLAADKLLTVSRSMLEKDLAFMRKPKPQGLGAPIGLERDPASYPKAKYKLIGKN